MACNIVSCTVLILSLPETSKHWTRRDVGCRDGLGRNDSYQEREVFFEMLSNDMHDNTTINHEYMQHKTGMNRTGHGQVILEREDTFGAVLNVPLPSIQYQNKPIATETQKHGLIGRIAHNIHVIQRTNLEERICLYAGLCSMHVVGYANGALEVISWKTDMTSISCSVIPRSRLFLSDCPWRVLMPITAFERGAWTIFLMNMVLAIYLGMSRT